MSYYHHLIKSAVVPAYGALTTAWIAATSETDTTIISALNTLETDLTTYGLTSKMKALYPFCGGTAAKHKFNFLDARDLDAAYRLTFSGGWTHSSTGALPNGTNAYANTFIIHKDVIPRDSGCLLYYSNSVGAVTSTDYYDMGAYSVSSNLAMLINFNSNMYNAFNDAYSTTANTHTHGLYSIQRISSTQKESYKNGTRLALLNTNSVDNSTNNNPILIGSINIGSYFGNKRCAFSAISTQSLTSGEQANLYTAVQAFNTTLLRNV